MKIRLLLLIMLLSAYTGEVFSQGNMSGPTNVIANGTTSYSYSFQYTTCSPQSMCFFVSSYSGGPGIDITVNGVNVTSTNGLFPCVSGGVWATFNIVFNNPGNYVFGFETDAGHCTGVAGFVSTFPAQTVTANNPPPCNAGAGADQTTTCTNPTASLTGFANGGTPGYTFSWSPATGLSNPNIQNPIANPSVTTTYTLTINDSGGCTDTDQITVIVNETPPTANAGANVTTTCTTPTQVLSGSGGGTYSWSPSTGLSNPNIANPTANPASTTNYTLTVTGANGCTDTDVVTVTVNETPPTANAGANVTTTCTTPTQVLSGSGGGTYSWSPTTGLSNPNIANPTANPASTTNYTLTVTAANGCTDTDVVTVTVNETPPTANAGANVTTTCTTPTQVLSGSGGGTYSWSPSTGLSNPNIANPTANPTSTTNYTLTVTAANGCTDTDVVTVTVNETPPTANAGTNVTTTCTTPTQVIGTSGGFSNTYSWSPATGLSDPNVATPTANPTSTQTYTVTVTGTNGCIATDAVTVTVDETAPTANGGGNQTTTCTNPTQVLNGSGGGTYSWSPATGLSDPNIANPTADPATTTNYTLTVTGANGCTDTDAVTVTVDEAAPTVDAGTDQTIPCGSTSVNLSATGTGTFSWSPTTGLSDPNIANPVASPTGATTYVVTLTGANGCTATDDVQVDIDVSPTTSSAGTDQTICVAAGSTTLAANAPTVGTGVWTQVSGPPSTITNVSIPNTTVTGLTTTGTYVYEWTISNAPCPPSSDQVTIQVDVNSDASFNFANPTYCQSSASDTANVTGNTGGVFSSTPAGLAIDPSTGIIDFATSTSGTYDVSYIISGACGASSTETITILAAPGPPNVTTTSGSTVICEGEQVELVGSGSGAGATYNVYDAASGGNLLGTTPLTVSPSTTSTYYVETVGTNGCTNLGGFSTIDITVNAAPTVNAGPNQTLCPGFSTNLTATGAPDFVWSTSETTASISVSPTVTTTYFVTGTGANGCSAEDSVTVSIVDPGVIEANDDQYGVITEEATILNVSANDLYTNGVVTVLTSPVNGQAVANGDGTITYTSNPGYTGPDSFNYIICDANCSVYCDTAKVELNVINDIEVSVSGGFSPNDDGTNETFNILGLENFPDNMLSVYNRWGSLVYQSSPYENDWDGTSNVSGLVIGEKLTTGTYLYVLDLGDGSDPLRGTLELKRD